MIPIVRLHYRLDTKLNKLASNTHQSISEADKDFALNEAILKLVKRKAEHSMDSDRKDYQDLQSLVVPHETLDVKERVGLISIYEVNLSDTTHKFFLPVDIYLTATKGGCKERVLTVESVVPHSDVPRLLSSTHHQPSFSYQATFATISEDILELYAEDPTGAFKIDKAYISYLRYPVKVCLGGYDQNFDEIESPQVDCDLPEYLENEILEIAVRDLAISTENEFAVTAGTVRDQTKTNP